MQVKLRVLCKAKNKTRALMRSEFKATFMNLNIRV